MFDLFGNHCVPGLLVGGDIISPDEELHLIEHIDAAGLSPFRFQQWTGKRLTRSFGWSYDFESNLFESTAAIPHWLHSLKASAAKFAGLLPGNLVQALIIRYDPGAGIGWHKDRPVFEHVVGISLGHTTTLRLRRRRPSGFDRASIELAPRSIYHLTSEARHGWEHSIAPMELPRWSITFRSLATVR